MNHGPRHNRDRAFDLLIARSTCGLSHAEAEELRELMLIDKAVDTSDDIELQRAIEATRHAVQGSAEAMPTAVREKVLQSFSLQRSDRGGAEIGRTSAHGAPIPIAHGNTARSPNRWWPMAAAAAILMAALVFVTMSWRPTGSAALIAGVQSAADHVTIAFKPGEGSLQGATGEVVWSDVLQRGYMRIKGAKANDPAVMQYQLWIVDPSRDKNPVDGGVFDIGSASSVGGDVLVPFESRLGVRGPKVFAITAEKPGGVVVSAGPLIMVAAR